MHKVMKPDCIEVNAPRIIWQLLHDCVYCVWQWQLAEKFLCLLRLQNQSKDRQENWERLSSWCTDLQKITRDMDRTIDYRPTSLPSGCKFRSSTFTLWKSSIKPKSRRLCYTASALNILLNMNPIRWFSICFVWMGRNFKFWFDHRPVIFQGDNRLLKHFLKVYYHILSLTVVSCPWTQLFQAGSIPLRWK